MKDYPNSQPQSSDNVPDYVFILELFSKMRPVSDHIIQIRHLAYCPNDNVNSELKEFAAYTPREFIELLSNPLKGHAREWCKSICINNSIFIKKGPLSAFFKMYVDSILTAHLRWIMMLFRFLATIFLINHIDKKALEVVNYRTIQLVAVLEC